VGTGAITLDMCGQLRLSMATVYGSRQRLDLRTWWRQLGQWRTVGELGIWRYQQNAITGQRRAQRLAILYAPVHSDWLRGGAWEQQRPAPPRPSSPLPEQSCRDI
jgi:hypothetical protein